MNIDKSWELMNREVTCDDLLHINVYNLPGKKCYNWRFSQLSEESTEGVDQTNPHVLPMCVCVQHLGCLIYISNSYGMDQNRDYFEVDFTTIFLMFGHSPSSNTIEIIKTKHSVPRLGCTASHCEVWCEARCEIDWLEHSGGKLGFASEEPRVPPTISAEPL